MVAARRKKLDTICADGSFLVLPAVTHGIHVVHVPGAIAAARASSSGGRFSWHYATAVQSLTDQIRITEFASFVQVDEGWKLATTTGKSYGPRCFADWYGCPDALLRPGHTYVCSRNRWGDAQLRALRVLWSFVGVDESGVRVRGEAAVIHIPRMMMD